jgi:hypothetical protein
MAKYFVHGILFLLIYFAMIFLWAFFLAALIMIGLFLGLILGFVALFFLIGGLNSFLTNIIWSIRVKTKLVSLLSHGLVLFIVLLLVNIPHIFITLVMPNPIVSLAVMAFYAFVDGFVAKYVAVWWKREPEEGGMMGTTPRAFLKKCVSCGREIALASETCPFCGSGQQQNAHLY